MMRPLGLGGTRNRIDVGDPLEEPGPAARTACPSRLAAAEVWSTARRERGAAAHPDDAPRRGARISATRRRGSVPRITGPIRLAPLARSGSTTRAGAVREQGGRPARSSGVGDAAQHVPRRSRRPTSARPRPSTAPRREPDGPSASPLQAAADVGRGRLAQAGTPDDDRGDVRRDVVGRHRRDEHEARRRRGVRSRAAAQRAAGRPFAGQGRRGLRRDRRSCARRRPLRFGDPAVVDLQAARRRSARWVTTRLGDGHGPPAPIRGAPGASAAPAAPRSEAGCGGHPHSGMFPGVAETPRSWTRAPPAPRAQPRPASRAGGLTSSTWPSPRGPNSPADARARSDRPAGCAPPRGRAAAAISRRWMIPTGLVGAHDPDRRARRPGEDEVGAQLGGVHRDVGAAETRAAGSPSRAGTVASANA